MINHPISPFILLVFWQRKTSMGCRSTRGSKMPSKWLEGQRIRRISSVLLALPRSLMKRWSKQRRCFPSWIWKPWDCPEFNSRIWSLCPWTNPLCPKNICDSIITLLITHTFQPNPWLFLLDIEVIYIQTTPKQYNLLYICILWIFSPMPTYFKLPLIKKEELMDQR